MKLSPLQFNGTGLITVELNAKIDPNHFLPYINFEISYNTSGEAPIQINEGNNIVYIHVHTVHLLPTQYNLNTYLPMLDRTDQFDYVRTNIQAEGQWKDNKYNKQIFDYLREQEKSFLTKEVYKQALTEYHERYITKVKSEIYERNVILDNFKIHLNQIETNYKQNMPL